MDKKIKKTKLGESILSNLILLRHYAHQDRAEASSSHMHAKMLISNSGSFNVGHVSTDGMTFFYPQSENESDDTLIRRITKGGYPLEHIMVGALLAKGGIMLDIGANIGLTSIPRAILGFFECIHAFEPEAKNAACLKHSIKINKTQGEVVVWENAVGNCDEIVDLTLSSSIGRHCVVANDRNPIEKKDETFEIKKVPAVCLTLNKWARNNKIDVNKISFIKLDVEGYEEFVLQGGQEILKLKKAAWQIEICPKLVHCTGGTIQGLCRIVSQYFKIVFDLKKPESGFFPSENLFAHLKERENEPNFAYTDIICLA